MVQITFHSAVCTVCERKLELPLTDHEYDEVVFRSESGNSFVACQVGEEPCWKDITSRVDRVAGTETRQKWDLAERALWVITRCADRLDGSGFQAHDFFCPACGSRTIQFEKGKASRKGEIPKATFHGYAALSPAARDAEVAKLWGESSKLWFLSSTEPPMNSREVWEIAISLLGRMPRPPRPVVTAVDVLLPEGFSDFPRECPGCGEPPETTQRVRFELRPFTGGETRELRVPFCGRCATLIGERRGYVVLRLAAATIIYFLLLNGLQYLESRYLFEDRITVASWIRNLYSFLSLVYIYELVKATWRVLRKTWYFGIRIVGADSGQKVIRARVDDPGYAGKLRASSRLA